MPRIPQYGSPAVGPVQTTNARFNAADNNGGVGGAIGRGLQGLGQVGADAAMVQAKIEDDLARTNADNLYLSASTAANGAVNDLKSRMGKDALDHRPAAGKAVEDAFAATLAQADRRTRRYLEPQLARLRMSADNEMATYALQQNRVYQQETGKAKLSNFIESAVRSDDPAERDGFFVQIRAQARANAELSGLADPEVIKADERSAISGAHAAIFDRYMAGEDVEMAQAYLEAHEGDMLSKDSTSRWADLKAPLQAREASADANMLMGIASADGADRAVNYADPLRGMGRGISGQYGEVRRDGHTHNGVDFPAPAGTPIFATAAGKVVKSGHDPASGNFVIIDHGDGTTSSYSHMQAASALRPGDVVTPDTRLGGVGSTGRSTGPHLHMVVRQNGKTVDPTKVIGAAQQSATRYDLDGLLAKADSQVGWTFERRERAKDEIRKRVSLSDGLKAREESDADRKASEWVLKQGAGFTDISQMPASIRNGLSPDAARSYIGVAKSNAKPTEIKANGARATDLELMRINDPEVFAKTPLGKFAGEVTPAELQGLLIEQAKMNKGDPDKSIRSKVASTIRTFAADDGLTGKENAKRRIAVQKIMEGEVHSLTGGKRNPTDDELYRAYQSATRDITYRTTTFFGGSGERTKPRYDLGADDVPADRRLKIIAGYKQTYGREPNDEEVGEIFRNGKGRFW